MSLEQLIRELSEFLPPERLVLDAGGLVAFESDGLTAFSVRPRAVAVPLTESDVVRIVQACARHEVPFVARGSGTSLSVVPCRMKPAS